MGVLALCAMVGFAVLQAFGTDAATAPPFIFFLMIAFTIVWVIVTLWLYWTCHGKVVAWASRRERA